MAGGIAFLACSLILAALSWKSLSRPRSHGFYRFFAWEMILGLFLLNVNSWFHDPFAWHQILAWLLLSASLIPLGFGVHALRKRGKPVATRENDSSLMAFERTTLLVTSGIYKYTRHPLYSSLLLLAWGVFFKLPSWTGIILVFAATALLIFTARADERECIRFFGAPYQDYMKKTRMFIPFLF